MSNIQQYQQPQPLVRGGVNILAEQQRMREIGRIRIGEKKQGQGNSTYPGRIECFRLTSADKKALEAAASIYGGTVRPWQDKDHPGFYELYTESRELDIYVAPMPLSQCMECYSKAGRHKECNGEVCTILATGERKACTCPIDNPKKMLAGRAEKGNPKEICSLNTKFSVILYKVPGVGIWLVSTASYYAAVELPPTAMQLQRLAYNGKFVKARLAAPLRRRVTNGQTKIFPVLEIRVDLSMGDVTAALGPSATLSTLSAMSDRGEDEAFDEAFDEALASAEDEAEVVEPEVVGAGAGEEDMRDLAAAFGIEIGEGVRTGKVWLSLTGAPDPEQVREVLKAIEKSKTSITARLLAMKTTAWAEFAKDVEVAKLDV